MMKMHRINTISAAVILMLSGLRLAASQEWTDYVNDKAAKFDNVQMIVPIERGPLGAAVQDYWNDDEVRELTDMPFYCTLRCRVGESLPEGFVDRGVELATSWGKPLMGRIWRYVSMDLSAEGLGRIKLSDVHDPANGKYDYADVAIREKVSQGLFETVRDMPVAWMMIDEPIWGYRGLKNPSTLPISDSLKKLTYELYGETVESIQDYKTNRKAWNAFVKTRNQAVADTLLSQLQVIRRAGKKTAVNFMPSSLECGPVTGLDIPSVMDSIADDIDHIMVDPYYTAFMENPRFVSFFLRFQENITPSRLPMVGFVDSVDSVLEGLGIRNPPAISMRTQIASYLANGCDHLAVWSYGYLVRLGNRDEFMETTRWMRNHNNLYNHNPRMVSRAGLYFSNPTFFYHDYFPRAWSHGTGPLGQYFDVLHTFYSLTYKQTPVQVVVTALGQEEKLSEKLENLNTLIMVNALVMTDAEFEAIGDWVRTGGNLIAAGRCGVENELGEPRKKTLATLGGVELTVARRRRGVRLSTAWPNAQWRGYCLNVAGSSENLYIDTYRCNKDYADTHLTNFKMSDKFPLWAKSKSNGIGGFDSCDMLSPMTKYSEAVEGVLGAPSGVGLVVPDTAVVLANYYDGEVAAAEIKVGLGTVSYIGPVDWLANDRDPLCRQTGADLVQRYTPSLPVVTAKTEIPSLEFTLMEKSEANAKVWIFHFINHVEDDQYMPAPDEPIREIVVRCDLPDAVVVEGVEVYSPDVDKPIVEHMVDDGDLTLRLDRLNVYAAVEVTVKEQAR